MTLVPMLRDYKSLREVRDAFHADKDFRIADMSSRWDGKPVNKSLDRHCEELAEAFNEGLERNEARNQRRLWLENNREKPRKKRA